MSKWNRPCRLKKEARPFFKEELAREINDYETWTKVYNIDEKALEEVKEVYITYGHKTSDSCTTLGGWSNPENEEHRKDKSAGGAYYFAIHFPSMNFEEHDKFSKGRMIAGLMDRIQRVADNYFNDFAADKLDELGDNKNEKR